MSGQQLAIVVVLISPVNNFPVHYVHITKEERKRKKKKKKRKTRGSEIDNKDLFWPNTLGRWGFRWFCTSLIEENNWSNTKGAKKNQRNFIKDAKRLHFSHFTFGSKVRGKSLLEANKNYARVGFRVPCLKRSWWIRADCGFTTR